MAPMGVLRVTGDGDPEQVFVNVTGNFFRVFRVPAHLGERSSPEMKTRASTPPF